MCVCVRNIHNAKGHRSKERAIPEPGAKCPVFPDKPAACSALFVDSGFFQLLADGATLLFFVFTREMRMNSCPTCLQRSDDVYVSACLFVCAVFRLGGACWSERVSLHLLQLYKDRSRLLHRHQGNVSKLQIPSELLV